MTDETNPQTSTTQPKTRLDSSGEGSDEFSSNVDDSDLDELLNSDPAVAPDIADRLASVLADRLEARGRMQGGDAD